MNNGTIEYGWPQNQDYVGGQLVDPPNEYITVTLKP